MAGDFALTGVGYASFNAVILIFMRRVDSHRNRNSEAAVGVESALVLLLLGGAVGIVGIGIGVC
jgi:hypothetical protein